MSEQQTAVDLEGFNVAVGGIMQDMLELMKLFIRETDRQMGELEKAVSGGEIKTIKQLAHTMAGAAYNCGLPGLAKALKDLDVCAAREDVEGARIAFPKVKEEAGRVRAALVERLGQS